MIAAVCQPFEGIKDIICTDAAGFFIGKYRIISKEKIIAELESVDPALSITHRHSGEHRRLQAVRSGIIIVFQQSIIDGSENIAAGQFICLNRIKTLYLAFSGTAYHTQLSRSGTELRQDHRKPKGQTATERSAHRITRHYSGEQLLGKIFYRRRYPERNRWYNPPYLYRHFQSMPHHP